MTQPSGTARTISALLTIFAYLLLLVPFSSAQDADSLPPIPDNGGADTPPSSLLDTPLGDSLLAQAQAQGSLRLIVDVAASDLPALPVPDRLEQAQQRSAQGQQALLSSLNAQISNGSIQVETRYTYTPQMVMTADADGVQALLESPLVLSVQPDALDSVALAESGPVIGLPDVQALGYSGAGYAVAIIDTGVQADHPFLLDADGESRVIAEACFNTSAFGGGSRCPGGVTSSTAPASGADCVSTEAQGCSHGTHVAGIAVGRDPGGLGFSGVAPDADIIALNVFGRYYCPGSNCQVLAAISDQVSALNQVLALHAQGVEIAAVNMSLGGSSTTDAYCADSREAAINQLRALGVATVISSGNQSQRLGASAPGCIRNAVTVSSTDASTSDADSDPNDEGDDISWFSNMASTVDLLAPGYIIESSYVPDAYANLSGTSMAAPHVSGAFALLRQVVAQQGIDIAPADLVDLIELALQLTGTTVKDQRSGGVYNHPRINLDTAVADVAQPQSDISYELANVGAVGWHADIALGAVGLPLLAAYDAAAGAVRVIECQNKDCSQRADTVVTRGGMGDALKLFYDAAGDAIVLLHHHRASGNLWLTRCAGSCADGTTSALVAGVNENIGSALDAVFDPVSRQIKLVALDQTDPDPANWSLLYKACHVTLSGCDPTQTIATVGANGGYPAIALNSAGVPLIAYRDGATNSTQLYRCDDATCATGSVIDSFTSGTHFNGFFNAAASGGGGITFASYSQRDSAASDLLRVVTCSGACTAVTSNTLNVDREGYYLDIALDPTNALPVLAYYDFWNDRAEILRCGDALCVSGNSINENVRPAGAFFNALALNDVGDALLTFSDYAQGDDWYLFDSGQHLRVPPYVLNTAPADGATRVTPASDITLSFSEPVTLAPDAISVNCDGNITTHDTLTISTSTTGGESCTVTVAATKVSDTDSYAANLLRDYVFSFTVDAGTVAQLDADNSLPAPGAVDFSTHTRLDLVFTAPVYLPVGSVTLTCGSESFALSGLPTSNTADANLLPLKPLQPNATCTLDVTAFRERAANPGDEALAYLADVMGLSSAQISGLAGLDAGPLEAVSSSSYTFKTGAAPTCFVFNADNEQFSAGAGTEALAQLASGASVGDTLQIGGTCSATTQGASALLTLDRDLTLQGGYPVADDTNTADPTYWLSITANPHSTPTLLDGAGLRRVLTVQQGADVTLDGFTLQNGADGSNDAALVGGILNRGNLTLTNSTLTDNNRGILNATDATLRLTDSIVQHTSFGRAIENRGDLFVSDSIVRDNTAGGILNTGFSSDLLLRNTRITGNNSSAGAGLNHAGGVGTLVNTLIDNNTATTEGGAIRNVSILTLVNSTLADNTSQAIGGAVGNSGIMELFNSIVWGNDAVIGDGISGSYSVVDSIVQGGAGNGAYEDDPQFTDAANGDYTLQALSPAIDRGNDNWLDEARLQAELSGAANADLTGDGFANDRLTVDLNGAAREVNGRDDFLTGTDASPVAYAITDLGAYESQLPENGAPLRVDSFNATPDHVTTGTTALAITYVQRAEVAANPTNTPRLNIYYSPDATCDTSDTLIAQHNVISSDLTLTLDLSANLALDMLWQQSVAIESSGRGSGAISQDVSYLCALIEPEQSDTSSVVNSIDAPANKLILADDITYFPFDVTGDNQVTRDDVDALLAVLGQSSPAYDRNGDGLVTQSEVAEILLRLGYVRNEAVIEAAD